MSIVVAVRQAPRHFVVVHHQVRPGRLKAFLVVHNPKRRTIHSQRLSDRLVHPLHKSFVDLHVVRRYARVHKHVSLYYFRQIIGRYVQPAGNSGGCRGGFMTHPPRSILAAMRSLMGKHELNPPSIIIFITRSGV